jgi:H+/Cl- antiporter ClcA
MNIKIILKSLLATFLISALVPLVYVVFTDLVHFMQELIWFDIAKTDENKLAIIPLSILGGIVLSGALLINKRIAGRELSHEIKDLVKDIKITPKLMLTAFIIGAISLIGGASLGPEAILIPISYGVGYLLAKSFGINKPQIYGLIAIVSLLASFFNGFFAAILPFALISIKVGKNRSATTTFIILGAIAALTSVALLRFSGIKEGYVKLPTILLESITPTMIIVAVVVGFIATYMASLIRIVTNFLNSVYKMVPKNWLLQGFIAGLGIGIIYYLIGPVGFFSGHTALESLNL